MVEHRRKKTFLAVVLLIDLSQGLICQDSSIRCEEILSIDDCTEDIYEENCCICGAGNCPDSPWARLFIHIPACGPSCRNPDVGEGEECPGRYITDCACWQSTKFFNDEKTRCIDVSECPSTESTLPTCEDPVAEYTNCTREFSCVPTCRNPFPGCNDCDGAGCQCPKSLVLDESTGLCIRYDDCPDIENCEKWYPTCIEERKCALSASIEGCMNPYTCCDEEQTCSQEGAYSICVNDDAGSKKGEPAISTELIIGICGGAALVLCIITACCFWLKSK